MLRLVSIMMLAILVAFWSIGGGAFRGELATILAGKGEPTDIPTHPSFALTVVVRAGINPFPSQCPFKVASGNGAAWVSDRKLHQGYSPV
ncbi:hypothetical protein RDV64_06295 [Acuticoccus sp. MNP-M23]|uniref:hypothetical protein n=1 Tax=Acuticoccus sp. MNP-M23 TaxID=3072793 RepID=UPI002814D48F|nr:hypothetical protein [Acuticoccus sp. MNP-M23]WMS44001.1 hypothetical protein RDV64_06295 [Acuticoccus sp. MNP-M23]